MWRMNVSASIQKASTSPGSVDPLGAEHVALEAHVVGLRRREGGEVVGARQRRRAGVERGAVERPRPPERPPPLERARRRAREHAVAVGAASARRGGRRSPPAPPRWRSTATSAGSSAFRLRSGAGSPAWLATCPTGVHAAVGPPGDGQLDLARAAPWPAPPPARPARCAAPAGAPSPANSRAVVLEQQPGGQRATRACARRSGRTRSRLDRPPSPRSTAGQLARLRGELLELLRRQVLLARPPTAGAGAELATIPSGESAATARAALDLHVRGEPVEPLAHRGLVAPLLRQRRRPAAARSAADAGSSANKPSRRPGGHAHRPARAHHAEHLLGGRPAAAAR